MPEEVKKKQAILRLQVDCSSEECDGETTLEIVQLEPGKNPDREIKCTWCNEILVVPAIWIKG